MPSKMCHEYVQKFTDQSLLIASLHINVVDDPILKSQLPIVCKLLEKIPGLFLVKFDMPRFSVALKGDVSGFLREAAVLPHRDNRAL